MCYHGPVLPLELSRRDGSPNTPRSPLVLACHVSGAVLGVCDVAGMVAAGALTGVVVDDTPQSWLAAVSHGMAVLRKAYQTAGYVFVEIKPYGPEE